ncbi:methyl-accepting chemotaxis protein [Denitrificimonas caeni]|uniref:methyl-accepting chemotaxis protein n=1 Tax=Denitrificimonas caeni TaxID=521720 RepID=UPI0003B3FCCF|nr:methyl-accepting chemotaxis protein [Denitrificimonas caeni]
MQFLRQISISKRLWLIFFITVGMFFVFGALALKQSYEVMHSAKATKTQHIVESTLGTVEYFHELEKSGQLTTQQAQEQAKSALSKLRYGRNDYVWINDLNPNMIMHPMSPALDGKDLSGYKDPDGIEIFNEFVRTAKQQGSGFVSYRWPMPGASAPVDKISYVQLFKPWNWVVGSGVYLDDIQAEFRSVAISASIMSFVIILFIAVLIINIMRSIVKPIENVVEAMQNIASGDGDLTQELSVHGKDEVTQLSLHYNTFALKLRTTISHLLNSAATLKQSAEALGNQASQALHISEDQSQQTEQIATAINEVTYAVQDVAKHAEQAATEVSQATEQANSGQINIDNSLKQTDKLSATIEQAVNVMQKLAEESSQVGRVLDVIRSIAEQTNLLALNAAIEAARAGEQGRGFAVVADEVRLLAQRTQQSTDEVQKMLESLQQNSQAAVQVINESSTTAQATVEQAQQAQESLTIISNALHMINGLNASIASATLQQSHVAEEINQNVTQVAGLSQSSNEAAHQLSASSEQLNQLALELNRQLAQFKV